MRFRTQLVAASGAFAVITLGVSLLGYWQANRLGSALYEVGVVRLPGVLGLNMLSTAKTRLNASARIVSLAGISDSTVAAELQRQTHTWALAEQGWAIYEPLPQTADEAAAWKAFVPAWKAWKSAYADFDSSVARRRRAPNRAGRGRNPEDSMAVFIRQGADVDSLLTKLTAIQYNVADAAKIHSVDSFADFASLRTRMLFAALISVLGVVGWSFYLGRRMSRPLADVAASISRVAHGDLTTPLTVRSADEIGEIAIAVNAMMRTQRATEDERATADEARRKSEEKFRKSEDEASRAREEATAERFAAILDERARLARELHDTLLQGFTGVGLKLVAVTNRIAGPPETVAALRDVIASAQGTLANARRAIWDIRPSLPAEGDFVTAMRAAAEEGVRGTGVALDFTVDGTAFPANQNIETAVFRVAQESISNVVKHAAARTVRVVLGYEAKRIRLTVVDDGQGFVFDPGFHAYGGHLGLLGMKERASHVQGTLEVLSSHGHGTEIVLVVPRSSFANDRPHTPSSQDSR